MAICMHTHTCHTSVKNEVCTVIIFPILVSVIMYSVNHYTYTRSENHLTCLFNYQALLLYVNGMHGTICSYAKCTRMCCIPISGRIFQILSLYHVLSLKAYTLLWSFHFHRSMKCFNTSLVVLNN